MILPGLEDELRAVFHAQSGAQPRLAELDDSAKRLLSPAPNVIEFITRREFMNAPSLYRYARSYQVLRDYFEVRCPICNKGGTGPGQPGDCMPNNKPRSRMYLESEVLLRWSEEYDDDVCPKCAITKSDLIEDGLAKGYSSVHLVVGQRSGKTVTAAYINCFIEHRVYCFAHTRGGLWRYLGMEPGDAFEMTVLAASDTQSKTTIWSKYTGYRRSSPWFKRYVSWIKEEEKAQPKIGMKPWGYEEGAKTIVNDHPAVRLLINSLNSNSNTGAGGTRVSSTADELARMRQNEGAQGAAEIYSTQLASLRTIRSRVKMLGLPSWLGTMASITSPMRKDDEAMRLLKKAPMLPKMYAAKYATWEFNPYEPRANFDEEYERDAVMAERNFGAKPAGAEHPLIPDVVKWASLALDKTLQPTVNFEIYERRSPSGHMYMAARVAHAMMVDDDRPRFMAFDAGKNFDAFTGAGGYGEIIVDDQDAEQKITVVEWVLRIVPPQGYEVWYDSVIDIAKSILPSIPGIARAEFDHWQSSQLVQQFRELGEGVEAEEVYTHPEEYTRWRGDCYIHRFRMPWPDASDYDQGEPLFEWIKPGKDLSAVSAAIYELTSLERDPDTGTIRNPRKGQERGANSDDAAQAVVRLHNMIQKYGYSKRYYDNSKIARAQRGRDGLIMSPTIARGAAALGRTMSRRGW